MPAGDHRSGSGEAAVLLDDGDAERLETLHRIVRRDRGDDAVNMVVNRGVVDLGRCEAYAEPAGPAGGLGGAGRRDQRLGRDAADIETVAAHPVAFDEHHGSAHLGGAGGNAEPARPGPDDAEIDPMPFHEAAPRRAWMRL